MPVRSGPLVVPLPPVANIAFLLIRNWNTPGSSARHLTLRSYDRRVAGLLDRTTPSPSSRTGARPACRPKRRTTSGSADVAAVRERRWLLPVGGGRRELVLGADRNGHLVAVGIVCTPSTRRPAAVEKEKPRRTGDRSSASAWRCSRSHRCVIDWPRPTSTSTVGPFAWRRRCRRSCRPSPIAVVAERRPRCSGTAPATSSAERRSCRSFPGRRRRRRCPRCARRSSGRTARDRPRGRGA